MSTPNLARGKTTAASNAGSFTTYAHGAPDLDLGADPFVDGFGSDASPAVPAAPTPAVPDVEDAAPAATAPADSTATDPMPWKAPCTECGNQFAASTQHGLAEALNVHLAQEHGMDIIALATRETIRAQVPIKGHTQPNSKGLVTFYGSRNNALVTVDHDSEEFGLLRAEYLRQNPPGPQADGSWRPYWQVDGRVRTAMRRQIGQMNLLAISGGRITPIEDGIELPVSSGYKVRVHLHPNDTYVVERVMTRGDKTFHKGRRDNVYGDELHQVTYYASCFRNDEYNDPDNWL
jgi:predicted small metal-binding protein